MKLCRFENQSGQACIGVVLADDAVLDLTGADIPNLSSLLESEDLPAHLALLAQQSQAKHSLRDVRLLCPIEKQEVWAAGVTYLRSKKARMEESDFSATAYDRVYDAARPEIFFKSPPEKVVSPGEAVGIRKDARWNVPEPELALVINSRGRLVGYTIGNDMSARDIEGENLLYLPQAKIYDRSCAIGPCIVVGADETAARSWRIQLRIQRASEDVFQGETSVGQIKRTFDELVSYLFRIQTFPSGAVLVTGTGIVPPDGFSLQSDDKIQIRIDGIGILENSVVTV